MPDLPRIAVPPVNARDRVSLIFETMILALAPVLTWIILRINLINQDGGLDPWYYTGYGRIFPLLYEQFGWPYYATRFPVIALNEAASLLPPVVGFGVLRYLLLLVCGLPLYAWTRQSFGRGVALLSYLFLFWSPLLPRTLLWDYPSFVSIPLALAGVSLWLWSNAGSPQTRFLTGVLWMASIASHLFTATAIGTFVIVQMIRRIRNHEIGRLLRNDVLWVSAGAGVCLILGFIYYHARIGSVDLQAILESTRWSISLSSADARARGTPLLTWASREYYAYIPLLCVLVSGVLLRRRLLDNTAVSSVWWFAAAYTGMYLVYQLLVGYVMEQFYYFAHLTLVVFLLLPLIIHELASGASHRLRVLGGATTALLVVPAANRLAPAYVDRISASAYGNMVVAAVLFAVGVWLTAKASWFTRRRFGAPAAAAAFMLLIQVFAFMNSYPRSVYDPRRGARETDVYLAALSMLDVFASYSRQNAPVMLWFCERKPSLQSIASSVLLLTLHRSFIDGRDACDSRLGEYERARLTENLYVMMLDEDGSSFQNREAALQEEGYALREILSRTIGGDTYHASLRLVQVNQVSLSREASRVLAMPSVSLVRWDGYALRTLGFASVSAGGPPEALSRTDDGSWTFTPAASRDHFVTPYIPIFSAQSEQWVDIDVTPSPAAGTNCVLHVQNQNYENIGRVPCSRDGAKGWPALIHIPLSATSIRLYLSDPLLAPIVLPREVTVTLHAPDAQRLSLPLVHWDNDALRTLGFASMHSDNRGEALYRTADGTWAFRPATSRDHFVTPYIPIPSTQSERFVAIEVTPSPTAGANCVLHVQNQNYEDIGGVPCRGGNDAKGVTILMHVPLSATSIRMYVIDPQHAPIVLPRDVTVTLHASEANNSAGPRP